MMNNFVIFMTFLAVLETVSCNEKVNKYLDRNIYNIHQRKFLNE